MEYSIFLQSFVRQWCIFNGNCLVDNIKYKVIVRKEGTDNDEKIYIGTTEPNRRNV